MSYHIHILITAMYIRKIRKTAQLVILIWQFHFILLIIKAGKHCVDSRLKVDRHWQSKLCLCVLHRLNILAICAHQ